MRALLEKHSLRTVLTAVGLSGEGEGSDVPIGAFIAGLSGLGGEKAAARTLFGVLGASVDNGEASVLPPATIVAGLSVLCTSDAAAVVDATFTAFDSNASGELTLDEMSSYLRIALVTTMQLTKPGPVSAAHLERARNVAAKMTRATFDRADADHSGAISRVEFAAWSSSSIVPPLDESRLSEGVAEFRAALRSTPLADAVSMMRRGGGPAGEVRRSDFVRVVGELCAREHEKTAAAATVGLFLITILTCFHSVRILLTI